MDRCSEAGVDTAVKGRSLEILQGLLIIPRWPLTGGVPYSTSAAGPPRHPSQWWDHPAVEGTPEPLDEHRGPTTRGSARPGLVTAGRPRIAKCCVGKLPVCRQAPPSRFQGLGIVLRQGRCEPPERRTARAVEGGGQSAQAAQDLKIVDGGTVRVEVSGARTPPPPSKCFPASATFPPRPTDELLCRRLGPALPRYTRC